MITNSIYLIEESPDFHLTKEPDSPLMLQYPPLSGPSVASMLSVRQQNAAPCRIRDIVLTSGPGTPEALNLIECETFQSSLNFRSILMIMIKVNGSPPSLGMVF